MMTKYTILLLVAGVVVATLVSPLRQHLRSKWLWAGAGLSLLIFLPNLIWQIENDFISVEFLRVISERDVRLGRTEGYFWQQLVVNANPQLIFLWVMGLYYFLRGDRSGRFRAMGVLYLVPLVLFWVLNGRFYYMAPAYPMLIAAGTVAGEGWLVRRSENGRRLALGVLTMLFVAGAALAVVLMMPVYPVNSGWWDFSADVHDNFAEQIGWQEMAENVAGIYTAQVGENPSLGILAGNYGEAAAINLYGEGLGLPPVISPVNSYWYRSLPERPLEAVIVLGYELEDLETSFGSCEVVGQNGNSFGVANEESVFHPDIYLCKGALASWESIWPEARRFG
jgi:hypothetical protein